MHESETGRKGTAGRDAGNVKNYVFCDVPIGSQVDALNARLLGPAMLPGSRLINRLGRSCSHCFDQAERQTLAYQFIWDRSAAFRTPVADSFGRALFFV